MSSFHFKLDSVLKMRERSRDEAAQSYQQALQAIAKLDEQIAELLSQHDAQTPMQEKMSEGTVELQKLLESQRYQLQLQQQAAEIKKNREMIVAESEKRRLVLVEKERDVKAMEKLREKQHAEWQAEAARKEQIELDQWSGFQYWQEGDASGRQR